MRDIKRQHVDLRIPEHVSTVCLSGQATRTDRNMLVGWIGRRDQVIDRKPERALRIFISGNPNLGFFPSTTPRIDMRRRGRSKAMRAHRGDVIPRCLRRVRDIA